jgi:hypothetical protein
MRSALKPKSKGLLSSYDFLGDRRMKMGVIGVAVSAALVPGLAGFAQANPAPVPEPPPGAIAFSLPGPASPRMARIYFYRDRGNYLTLTWTTVWLNDTKIGSSGPGNFFYRDVQPGTYTVGVDSDVPYVGSIQEDYGRAGQHLLCQNLLCPGIWGDGLGGYGQCPERFRHDAGHSCGRRSGNIDPSTRELKHWRLLSRCGFRRHRVGVLMEPEVGHGTTKIYARVQA